MAGESLDYAAVTEDAEGRVFYRASALGNCETALVAIRMGMQTMAPSQMFQDKFEDGHVHEDHILKKAGDQDGLRFFRLQPDQPQDRVQLRITDKVFVVGHIDAIGYHPTHEVCVVDAKALSASSYEDWARGQFEAWPHYAWQQSAYAYALGDMRKDIDAATQFETEGIKGKPLTICMAVKNKNSSQVKCWYYPEPPVTRSQIMAKLIRVEALASKGEIPKCTVNDFLCPVWYLHEEKVEKILNEGDRTMIAGLATVLLEEQQKVKAAEAAVKRIKAELKDLVGVGESTRVEAGRISVYKTKNPARFDKERFIEDHPGVDLDQYYVASERVEVRVTPPKPKE